MRIRGRDELKINPTGCIIVPASLFVALMIATAGFAVWPGVVAPGAAIVCGSGEVVHAAHEYRRPGEYSLIRQIYCQTGSGKQGAREEITFPAMGVSFLIYAAVLFLLLQFLVRPLVARRLRRKMEALGFGGPAQQGGWPGAAGASGLGDILGRVQDAVRRGEAEVRVRNVSVDLPGDADGGDIGARLAQLKALRDQGLISAQDYEAKKAEILAGL
ncbi:MAG TPA: SHOCT domain-containing protein [Allosphingosinicella sp.]|nr:SHOCT domain-containing protein [Allosphingosinicella sp.]